MGFNQENLSAISKMLHDKAFNLSAWELNFLKNIKNKLYDYKEKKITNYQISPKQLNIINNLLYKYNRYQKCKKRK